MPEPYDREGLIDRATDAINEGNPTKALDIAEEIRKGEGPNADEALIRGIALSSLGRTAEASDAFAEATRRAPKSHKARFNAAVHEFNAGNVEGARVLADEALALDPMHSATRSLAEKIAGHGNPAPDGAEPPQIAPPVSADYSAYARPLEEEALPWIGKLGRAWITIGVLLLVLNFLTFVSIGAMAVQAAGGTGMTISAGMEAGAKAARDLQHVPLFQLLTYLDFFARVAGIGWTVLDLVRRRGNFLWLFGVIPLACLSMGWAIIPFYILFGRKS